MRFDAWAATFPNEYFHELRGHLQEVLGATFQLRKGGKHGYRTHEGINIDGNCHGLIAHGGNGERFFLEITGEPSDAWAKFVHAWDMRTQSTIENDQTFLVLLSRADVCYDWLDPKDVVAHAPTFREHVASRLDTRGRPPQWDQRGDWSSEAGRERGCTLYMGSPKSQIRVRFYDKGAELRVNAGVDAPLDMRRVEVQYRPESKADKMSASRLPASGFWRISPAVKAVAEYFGCSSEGNFVRVPRPQAEVERKKDLACFQYGESIVSIFGDVIRSIKGSEELMQELALEVERRRARTRSKAA